MIQLVRESPPGFGGVERVAHELATALTIHGDPILTCCLAGPSLAGKGSKSCDPLPVTYPRASIPTLRVSKLLFPLPSQLMRRIISSYDPLLLHLPCPALLIIGIIASLVNRERKIYVYWHAFLHSPNFLLNCLYKIYEKFAYYWFAVCKPVIISTSPVLAAHLDAKVGSSGKSFILPCCLSREEEILCLKLRQYNEDARRNCASSKQETKVAFVGRVCAYKRVDLLIRAFALSMADQLYLIGYGDWNKLKVLASNVVPASKDVFFLGCLNEIEKLKLLASCDIHILPSLSSNEAFGIAQLEAMACGLAACSPQIPESGISWVNGTNLVSNNGDIVHALSSAINQLCDPCIQIQHKDICHLRYLQIFSRKAWLTQLQNIRKSMVSV